jgi:hypothetical protein
MAGILSIDNTLVNQKVTEEELSTDSFTIFFLQRLHEALFDYSPDSFKAPALNSHLRIVELNRIGGQAENQEFISASIDSFFLEISWSIQSDPIIRGGRKQLIQELLMRVKNGWGKRTQFLPAMSALLLQFRDYRARICQQLQLEASKSDWSKARVIQLLDALIVEYELIGFPRPYIYSVVQKLSTKNKQKNLNGGALHTVELFLEMFTFEPKDYSVIGYVSHAMAKAIVRKSGWSIHDAAVLGRTRSQKNFVKFHKNVDLSLTTTAIEYKGKSVCQHGAVKDFFNVIDRVGEQVQFLDHHLPVHIHNKGLCIDSATTFTSILPRSSSPLSFISRTAESELATGLNLLDFFFNESRLSYAAKARLSQAIEYHGAALASKRHEEQLLNLWSCLEGFVGVPSTAGSKIAFVWEAVLSCLTLQYPQRLFSLIANRILELFGEAQLTELFGPELIEVSESRERLALVLLNPTYEDKRAKLAELVSQKDSVLLYRLFELVKRFENPKMTKATLVHHREKLTWQMNRIYWNRNLIVHSAESLPYLSTLVEHLHIYVDSFLGSILFTVGKVQATSIPSVLELFSVHEKIRMDELVEFSNVKNVALDSTLDWVFGCENILREASGL